MMVAQDEAVGHEIVRCVDKIEHLTDGAIVGVLVLGAVVYLLVARARRAGDSGAAPKTDSHPGTGR